MHRRVWAFYFLVNVITLFCGAVVVRKRDLSLEGSPCGTTTTDEDIQRTFDALKDLTLSAASGRRQVGPARSYAFDVVWHIVAANLTYAGGWVPDSQITAQMELLNRNYEGTGISWKHAETLRVISPHWHYQITSNSTGLRLDMQGLLRQGGATTLNVYTLGFPYDTVNGFSSLPVNYRRNAKADGIAIRFTTLPGGGSLERSGGTLTHESAHWLGLRHTFEGGCEGIGDSVDDTPAEASPAFGCPVGRDSCPNQPGLDPITNFMDYTDESCRAEFTPGQIELMHTVISAFRPNERGIREGTE